MGVKYNCLFLNLFLLPPIIFQSGWSIRRRDFISQLGYILIFAIVGTLILTAVVGTIIYNTGKIKNLSTVLAYASLISAVDPVATLATYSSLQVEPLLNIFVLGESTINDAVAIALFNAANTADATATFGQIAWNICWMFTGSLVAGLVIGALLICLLRVFHLQESPDLTVMALTVTPFFTYVATEILGLSGIIATLFCGMFMNVHLKPHLEMHVISTTDFQLKQIASVADMTVFLLVGIAVCLLEGHAFFGFTSIIAGACLLGRFLATFPLGGVVNLLKYMRGKRQGLSKEECQYLSCSHLTMMWHAGLRGGIAMALCLQVRTEDRLEKEILEEATFMIIVAFLLLFGGSTKAFLDLFKIPVGVPDEEAECRPLSKRPSQVRHHLFSNDSVFGTKLADPRSSKTSHEQSQEPGRRYSAPALKIES